MILTGKVTGLSEYGDQIQVSLHLDEKPGSIDHRFLLFKVSPAEAPKWSVGRKVRITVEPQ